MKVVFLDIDGVLNAECDFVDDSGNWIRNSPRVCTNSGESYNGISQRRVSRLKAILVSSGAKVVLVSSWKRWYDLYVRRLDDDHIGKYLVNSLSRKKVRIFDSTSRCEKHGFWRGDGILRWIGFWDAQHPEDPVESIVILDDEEFDYEAVGLDRYWLRTNYCGGSDEGGLLDRHVEAATKKLGERFSMPKDETDK